MKTLRIALALALLASCGHPHPTPPRAIAPAPRPGPPPVDAGPIVGIALVVTPPDAEVSIDDEDAGKASALAAVVPLKPGLHQLVITADGYRAYRAELIVSDKTEQFVVRLEPKR